MRSSSSSRIFFYLWTGLVCGFGLFEIVFFKMTDEEVIKRRLLIDGDGTGDDRRLNVLLKTFIKWCVVNESPENNQIMYDRLLAQLAQCEFAVTKSDFATKMMKQELKNYEIVSETIEKSIEIVKKEIDTSKQDLILAKKIRKNRMEYDVLAKVINLQPDRKKTMEQLEILNKELRELEDTKAQLQRKLDMRKNDFMVLMRAIKELQTKLSDDNHDDDDDIIVCDGEPDGDKNDNRNIENNTIDDKMSIDEYDGILEIQESS